MEKPERGEGGVATDAGTMKTSPLFVVGMAMAGLAGLVFLGVGLLKPGQISPPENSGGVGKPWLAEAKKKSEAVRIQGEKIAEEIKALTGLAGKEGEHRVFVSAQLVYLPENSEPVQPLDRKMKTEDGIEVGWKMKYALDPADPQVKDEDPDGDGFTNLEEYAAQPPTDPTKKEDSPAKESKLKSRSGEPVPMGVSFAEKSGGLFTIRFQVGTKRAQFKGKPGDSFWVLAWSDGVEVLGDEPKLATARNKAKEAGRGSHAIPLKFRSYEEKVEKIKDEKAGGVEVEVDNSVIVLERKDALEGPQKLIFSTPQRPQVSQWDVGEIRFFTPASGGTEVGPFRVGEIFAYEGKEFAVVGREGKKIHLLNRSEPGKGPFWVPAEAALTGDSAKP